MKKIIDLINSKMSEDARLTYIGMIENEMPSIKSDIAHLVYDIVKNLILCDRSYMTSLGYQLFYGGYGDSVFMKELDNVKDLIRRLEDRIISIEDDMRYRYDIDDIK